MVMMMFLSNLEKTMLKKIVAGLLGLGFATAVYANCTTHTVTTSSGRMVTCTTCCFGGNCNTNCF